MDFDKENIKTLSNDQLFKLIKGYGIPCGPINQSTRSVYEKKLKNFLDGNDIDKSINTSIQTIQPKDQPVNVLSASSIGNESPSSKSRMNQKSNTTNKTETEQIIKRNTNGNEVPNATASQNKPAILTGIYDNISKNSINDRKNEYTSSSTITNTTTASIKNIPKEAYSHLPVKNNPTNIHNNENLSSSSSASTTTLTKNISRESYSQPSISSNLVNDNDRNNEYSSSYNNLSTKKMPTEAHSQSSTLTSRVQSQEKKPDLDFKLIKPSNTYSTASPTLSNFRRDGYGLLDDKNIQPTTLSSGYKHLDTPLCNNIRSRPTISRIENQSYSSVTKPIESEIKQQTVVKTTKGKSSLNLTYIILIAALFFGVYFFVNQILNSNPENPKELSS